MKKLYLSHIISVFLLTLAPVMAQRGVTSSGVFFTGGSYDGYGAVFRNPRISSASDGLFTGGDYDGYGSAGLDYRTVASSEAAWAGGSYDGYTGTLLVRRQDWAGGTYFSGGSYDGYVRGLFTYRSVSGADSVFSGGSYDGSVNTVFAWREITATDAAYTGGSYDGFSLTTSANDIALPVRVAAFTVSDERNRLVVRIKTASELNFAGFNILRAAGNDSAYAYIARFNRETALRARGNSSFGYTYEYVDKSAAVDREYLYKIEAVDRDGTLAYFGPVSARILFVPGILDLRQNYPNPFNPSTTIVFDIPRRAMVELVVVDVLGRIVDRVVKREMDAGRYRIHYQAHTLSSGTYFFYLSAENQRRVKKFILSR